MHPKQGRQGRVSTASVHAAAGGRLALSSTFPAPLPMTWGCQAADKSR